MSEVQRWGTSCSTMKSKATRLETIPSIRDRTEEKLVQKNPHTEFSKLEFREMVTLAKTSFEKTISITYEMYQLFTRTQDAGNSLESFHAALTAQAATSELATPEDELVSDLFISKTKNTVLQGILTFRDVFTRRGPETSAKV